MHDEPTTFMMSKQCYHLEYNKHSARSSHGAHPGLQTGCYVTTASIRNVASERAHQLSYTIICTTIVLYGRSSRATARRSTASASGQYSDIALQLYVANS